MLLAAQVGIAGSTVIEDDVVLAGQVGVAGHLRIGKGVVATAQTGIPNSVDAGAMISGYPAIRQPRLAEGVRRVPSAAGAEEAGRGARSSASRNSRRSCKDGGLRRTIRCGARLLPRASSSHWSRTATLSSRKALADAPAIAEFLSRYDFNMSAAKLGASRSALLVGRPLRRRL